MPAITSRHHALLKEWRRLRRPEVARGHSRVLLEGVQAVLQALGSSHPVEALCLCPELMRPGVRARTPVYELSAAAFAALSERDGPGVAAVIALRLRSLEEVTAGAGDIVLAPWRVEKPGNLRARAGHATQRLCDRPGPSAQAPRGA